MIKVGFGCIIYGYWIINYVLIIYELEVKIVCVILSVLCYGCYKVVCYVGLESVIWIVIKCLIVCVYKYCCWYE